MDWLPMDCAPKDGSFVLAWREDWDNPIWVQWRLNHRTHTTFWNDAWEHDCYEYEDSPPTLWWPVAPPPTGKCLKLAGNESVHR